MEGRRFLFVTAVAALAGCLDGPDATPDEADLVPPLPPILWEPACPAEGAPGPGGGACMTFAPSAAHSGAFHVTRSPVDPAVLVAAAWHIYDAPPTPTAGQAVGSHNDVDLTLSQDAGMTWSLVALPAWMGPDLPQGAVMASRYVSDLLIDTAGAVHATGWAVYGNTGVVGGNLLPSQQGPTYGFHVASPDLGTTWGDPLLWPDDNEPDVRLAVADDGAILSFRGRDRDGVEVHRSADGGATWALETELGERCAQLSAPTRSETGWTLACSNFLDAGVLLSYQPGQRLATVMDIPSTEEFSSLYGYPLLEAVGDGTFLYMGERFSGGSVVLLRPAGTDYDRLDLLASASLDDGWPATGVTIAALAVDAAGTLHAVLDLMQAAGTAGLSGPGATRGLYVGLRPATGDLVFEHLLYDFHEAETADPVDVAQEPGPFGYTCIDALDVDHPDGVLFACAGTSFAWTRVVPVPA